MSNKLKIPKTVFNLGVASLLTDIASEAIYPLLPLFLSQVIGASAFFIGTMEGIAETTASILKLVSGYLSDKLKRRTPFVFAGYLISGLARPLIGFAITPLHVLFIRFADRVGKGVRGAPRDAMIGAVSNKEERGRNFGFHRSMDHAGAVLGPIYATAFLFIFPEQYRMLFFSTIIFSILTLVYIFRTRHEFKLAHAEDKEKVSKIDPNVFLNFKQTWRELPKSFKFYLIVLCFFTLGNSADAFLLLKLKDSGVDVRFIPLYWGALHIVKMFSTYFGGLYSDKVGRVKMISLGWLIYAAIYFGMSQSQNIYIVGFLFLAYGLYYGCVEGVEQAFVVDLVPTEHRGTAFGLFQIILGVGALPASLLFGFLWKEFGPHVSFIVGATFALTSTILLFGYFGSSDGKAKTT